MSRTPPVAARSSLFLALFFLVLGGPTPRLAREREAREVGEAIAELGAIDREILMMRSYERLAYDEIACILEIDPAAARKRYGRALLRLRKTLNDRGLLSDES